MPAPDALAILREANATLRAALLRLRPERKSCSSIKPGELSDLLAQLLRAAECLQLPPGHGQTSADFDKEKQAYWRNLEALKQFLPGLHVRLLAEKSRLEAARIQVSAAAAWAQARRKAL